MPPAIEVVLETAAAPEPAAVKLVPSSPAAAPPAAGPPETTQMETPARREPAPRPKSAAKQDRAARAIPLAVPGPPASAAVDAAPVLVPVPAPAAVVVPPVVAPDEMARYAAAISGALAETRRRHRGPGGRAVVTFSLDARGRLVEASVAHGSGDPGLDSRALAIVRAAEFPPPPAGFTERERVFTVPFEFR